MHVRVDLVGELFLGEPFLLLVALSVLIARGRGPRADLRLFWLFAIAGLCMLAGYGFSDFVSASDPWQYVRGWARVVALLLTAGALWIAASHAPRHIWWFALGLGAGDLAKLIIDSAPLTHWKLGYGDAAVLLAATLGGLAHPGAAAAGMIGLGLLSIGLDYRSLGASGVLIGASLLWRVAFRGHTRWHAVKLAALAAAGGAAALVIFFGLQLTETRYETRRLESNLGRNARMEVAIQAVADSPFVGYGSWAASARYAPLIRREEERASAALKRKINLGDSLMPHSQLLQAWIEGGVLAAGFFAFYGWRLALALWWVLRRHRIGALTPVCLYAIYAGLWNLVASPFLGIMRVYIALAIAVMGFLAWEARRSGQ